MDDTRKKIVIFLHNPFSYNNGGTVVQYYLAQLLEDAGRDVKICNIHDNNAQTNLFNKFIDKNDITDLDNTIVIYCEGVEGNPLNAKYVIRWMLSKLGQNVPHKYYYTWDPQELVYFFNSEISIIDNNISVKYLTLLYTNPQIQNFNYERKGICFTIRKLLHIHKKVKKIHPPNAFEITRNHNQEDYITIFNKYKLFIAYDSLSFLSIIAAMCGCISVVYPIEGLSKREYFKMTSLHEYMVEKNINEIYGIAYGIEQSELDYSRSTLHLVKEQLNDIQNWMINRYIKNILSDIDKWNENKNILLIYKEIMLKDEFDVDFYREIYNDLNHLTNDELKIHYNNHGKNEGRFVHKKELMEYDGVDLFDVNIYRRVNDDLKMLTDSQIIFHYISHGKREGRISNKKQLLDYLEVSDFDFDFYRIVNSIPYNNISEIPSLQILIYLSDTQIMEHCKKYGKMEIIIAGETDFYERYPDFDINFYRKFNIELREMTDYELFKHYHMYGYFANEIYFEYDFILNDDYTTPNVSDKIKDLIYNHYYLRQIDTYEKLMEHYKIFYKKYFIFNKESFYKYYDDFDYNYYKNLYFNNDDTNHDINETKILLYYHLEGKYRNHKINNKTKLILYIPPFDIKCGGIVVLHYFAKLINNNYFDSYHAKLFMHNNIKYKNPFCNDFANINEIDDNAVVIYPEIISGNPLNAKNVVRWILLELGIEMPLNHYKTWNPTDLIYHWESIEKQLTCPFFNDVFTNKKLENRNNTCYIIKKARLIHKNIVYTHPENSICIDELSLQEINCIFNSCKYFYCYDSNSYYIIYAAICGCIPIIHTVEGVSEDDYFKSKITYFNNTIHNKGLVYGNNVTKIKYILEYKLNENNEEYYKCAFKMHQEKTFFYFLNDIKSLLTNDENQQLPYAKSIFEF